MAVWASAIEHDCETFSDSQRRMYGCDGTPSMVTFNLGGYEVKGCPRKHINPTYYKYLRAYRRYEKGYLPNDGGWMDQPAKFNDIIDLIEGQLSIIDRKKRNDKQRTGNLTQSQG